MDVAIWHKFSQHRDLKEELLATGDAELIEVCCCRLFSPRFRSVHIENPEFRQGSILGLWCRWKGQERTRKGACKAEDSTPWMKCTRHVPAPRVLALCARMYLFLSSFWAAVVPDSGIRVFNPPTRFSPRKVRSATPLPP